MERPVINVAIFLLTAIFCISDLAAQNAPAKIVAGIPVNYDESLSGTYTLPDPLLMLNGKRVKNAKTWYTKCRPAILRLFEEFQYRK